LAGGADACKHLFWFRIERRLIAARGIAKKIDDLCFVRVRKAVRSFMTSSLKVAA
jgi:hypothetical protein